jgi:protein-L-isoaspartate(D-aspartate) O-methyltransferase
MNFNYQKARDLMVENQLRPNKIKDPTILSIFKKIPKETFLSENLESLTYSDMDIDLGKYRGYLKNLHIAQLIKHSEIKKNHKILHIGALTGYVTSLLSDLCFEVHAIEEEGQYFSILKKNVSEIKNIKVAGGSFKDGDVSNAPFDRIIIDCPIVKVNKIILNQLSDKLGQIIMIEKNHENLNKAIKFTRNANSFSKEFLFDVFSNYELYREKKGFVF